uniref:Candidate secreted effector n=1 Tax=Meloidogyne incognita TaxID=6306 RepID=A0A914KWS2_MELIC
MEIIPVQRLKRAQRSILFHKCTLTFLSIIKSIWASKFWSSWSQSCFYNCI